MKRWLIVFFLAILGAMIWVTTVASLDRSVLVAAGELWSDPWGRATLFDAYFGFLTVFIWIAYREPDWARRILWLVLLLLLGNIAIAIYFLHALFTLPAGADWRQLFAPKYPLEERG